MYAIIIRSDPDPTLIRNLNCIRQHMHVICKEYMIFLVLTFTTFVTFLSLSQNAFQNI